MKHFAQIKMISRFFPIAIALLVLCGSISCGRNKRDRIELPLVQCIIIKNDAAPQDLNVEAYKTVLSAVSLVPRIESPVALEKIMASGDRLVLVIPMASAKSLTQPQIKQALALVSKGAILATEGITPLSKEIGFMADASVKVSQLEEAAYPDIEISWEEEESVTIVKPPAGAAVLTREKNGHGALACLVPFGTGKCLLLAAELDPYGGEGYKRFPYLIQELRQAGLNLPFRAERLSALFDYGFRYKDDPETLAQAWSKNGIQSLHVGAWNFYDSDSKTESYLRKLIESCHRNGILVYGWLELPHVSKKFWDDHPKWREKTATGRDAHIDWRYVMNLNDPDCFQELTKGFERLFRKFDWDGVNLGELYFDSPAGTAEPGSFTPLNPNVRAEYKKLSGIDPLDFFNAKSPHYWKRDASGWKRFIEYRIALERDLHERFIRIFSDYRKSFAPDLDIVVIYVDNIYDPSMREAVGADVKVMFDMMNRHQFTLVLEDPGTVWHLGPRRYAELANTYSRLTTNAAQLGIDINIIDRDITSYPTSKQTGSEFLELFYYASRHFQTVMAYAEQTMNPQDAEILSYAMAPATRAEKEKKMLKISSPISVIYHSGLDLRNFEVNGQLWPCAFNGEALLPAGTSSITGIQLTGGDLRPHLIKLNGNLINAKYESDQVIQFSYDTQCRAISIFDRAPKSLQIDGGAVNAATTPWLMLPRGKHSIRAAF